MLTYAQLVAQACSVARVPGFAVQVGLFLIEILDDLAQTNDFDVAKGIFTFNFNPGLTATVNSQIIYGGPYPLPADYLRAVDEKSVFWSLQGVPYPLIPCDLSEFDEQVQQAGTMSYPYMYATDMSQSPPVMWVYSPPSGAYPVTVRYRRQMPEISAPETNTTVPWFPNQIYLSTKLAAMAMTLSNDPRLSQFDERADVMLGKYLKLKDDSESRAKTVKLDRRRFGGSFSRLKDTKTVGW